MDADPTPRLLTGYLYKSTQGTRVFGRLADRMQRSESSPRDSDDTRIQLDGDVLINDESQGTTIKGNS